MGSEPKITGKQQQILNVLKGWSFNAYEICRILNGFDSRDFIPCFHNRLELSDRCRKRDRGCNFRSNSVDKALRTMWKRKIIKSIKLRWFDHGRAKKGICTDLFRFYFMNKKDLAARLKADIRRFLEND